MVGVIDTYGSNFFSFPKATLNIRETIASPEVFLGSS